MTKPGHIKYSLSDITDRDLPTVAVIGRPNVGKSTLFNRLTRSRRAIIDPTPGMTRDRLYGTVHRDQGSYRLVDTGGIEERPDLIVQMIKDQTHRAIEEASILLFVVDGREGITAGDLEIARGLRQVNKPSVLFVNKTEGLTKGNIDPDIYKLGFKRMVFGATEHGLGSEELLHELDELMEGNWHTPKQAPESEPMRLSIIGRPNVGKSSLVNRLLNEERQMVSNIPGTTRDPIDSYLMYKNQVVCLVDTAGIRKRGKIEGSQESLSVMMAQRQVEAADVVAVVIDATDPVAVQDAAIAGIADKAFKPIIVVVNKWDLVEDKETMTTTRFEDLIRRRLKFLETSPFLFISALTGQRVTKLLDMALLIFDRVQQRVSTSDLNRFVEELQRDTRMPLHKGKALKIFYMTQVEVAPPTFVAVVNQREPLQYTQKRFLVNRIREGMRLEGIPIKLIVKPRKQKEDN